MTIQRIPLTSREWEHQRDLGRKMAALARRLKEVGDDSDEGRRLWREETRVGMALNEHVSGMISARNLPHAEFWNYDPSRGCLWYDRDTIAPGHRPESAES